MKRSFEYIAKPSTQFPQKIRAIPVRRRRIAPIMMFIALALAAGCERPLPEQNTAAAQLYVSRCGQCHRAYAPGSLSAAMWQIQVQMMEAKMVQNRVPPLNNEERDTILSYLTRNAAHE